MITLGKAEEAVACFKDGFNCSQAILSTYCEEFGIEKKVALQIACGLGAGMGRQQETCGAVSGAYLLIGLKYGKYMKDDDPAKERTYELVREFSKRFVDRNGSVSCRALLGIDLLNCDRRLAYEHVQDECPRLVKDAAEIIEQLLFSSEVSK